MNKIFTRNIGMFPYSGERKVEGYGITMLKEFNEEEDMGVNYEFF